MTIVIPAIVLTALGLLFGAGLAWAGKVFAVENDPRVDAVRAALPGANCGACGFPGCDGLSMAIVAGEAPVNACPVGGAACAAAIASVMGVEAGAMESMVASVICQGASGVCHQKYEYAGINDCRAAALASGGGKACRYACLGLGTCAKNCPFNAIEMVNGIAHIDEEKCTGCKTCIAVCPKNVMRMEPRHRIVMVKCRATEKGKVVRDACTSGCLACGRCAKVCPHDAIIMNNNLPTIDYEKCVQCMECAKACPTGAIWGEGVEKPARKTAAR
jgi:Na+-translocating ferredoxin:NAD+ oxidoreductase RNF subunit RnfB